jgi:hypothetical protein
VWAEALTVTAAGTSAQPIVISGPSSGCATPPKIDGGTTLTPSAWSVYSGRIYRAALAAQPLLLNTAGGVFTEAHHPNVGYLASAPTSPYLALAADGNVVANGSGNGSTVIKTGPDLVLPNGSQLTAGLRVRVRDNSWTLDERTVSSVSGNQITVSSPTKYPLKAGWGYFLLGALWMLDSAG